MSERGAIELQTFDGCARCGGRHEGLEFKALGRPMAPSYVSDMQWTHWALCPVTGEPIMSGTQHPKESHEGVWCLVDCDRCHRNHARLPRGTTTCPVTGEPLTEGVNGDPENKLTVCPVCAGAFP